MISEYWVDDLPKYIWSVVDEYEVYEAKLGDDMRRYHGYPLDDRASAQRSIVLREWKRRS